MTHKSAAAIENPHAQEEALQAAFAELNKVYDFKPGDLVQWKPGLRNKRKPKTSEPAIVVAVLDQPIFDPSDAAAAQYFREPLDILLGVLDEDGDFIVFHYDRRRFEPYCGA